MFFNALENLEDILSNNKSYDLLLSMIENIPGPTFLLDCKHHLIGTNQECADVYGVPNDKAIGKSQGELPFKGSLLEKEFLKSDKKALTGGLC
jgi:PAS domain-containing protein